MKLQELFSSEDKWTKGTFARTQDEHFCHVQDPKAVCFCLWGGIKKCYDGTDIDDKIDVIVKVERKVGQNIVDYNDAPERTFSDIRKLIEELDI